MRIDAAPIDHGRLATHRCCPIVPWVFWRARAKERSLSCLLVLFPLVGSDPLTCFGILR